MKVLFKKIYNHLKRSEKEMLIKKSGSTSDKHHEKIRSGQSYLYKEYGMESEVIEVRFKDKVSGSFLNQALSAAIKRYPYFNTKLVELDGDFYIVHNDSSITARRTKKLTRLGDISCTYHLLDITYFGNSLYVAFHHALCDGRGVKPFVETLIYYYCRLRYKQKEAPQGVYLATDALLEGETDEAFLKEYDYDDSKEFVEISRDAFAIPENVKTEDRTNYRYEVTIPHSQFMRVCKENNATPAILLSLLMSKGIAELYPEYDKPINANIATDIRTALDVPNTFKNCVKSMILPYDKELASLPLEEQAQKQRELLNKQRDRDYCRKEANLMIGLFDKLDTLPSYEEKKKIMSFFDSMSLNTYIISYLGQFKLGLNEEYIEDIHLYNSGTTGLNINMISCSNSFVLDFKQNFISDKYVKALCGELQKLKIEYKRSDVIEFVTPNDSVIKRKKQNNEQTP